MSPTTNQSPRLFMKERDHRNCEWGRVMMQRWLVWHLIFEKKLYHQILFRILSLSPDFIENPVIACVIDHYSNYPKWQQHWKLQNALQHLKQTGHYFFKKQQWIHTALRNTRFRTNDISTCFVSVWDTLFHESFVFRVQEIEAKPDFFGNSLSFKDCISELKRS